jgi:2'-5' RNA ligase
MMLRSFIALEVPPHIQKVIASQTASLQRTLPRPLVRWVVEHNVHLTLQFLGDVSPANLDLLAQALRSEAAGHPTFEVSVGQVGAFPTPRRPRVIWVGLDAPAALLSLHRGIQTVTARMGYPPEERTFSPHLTIGRVRQNASAAELHRIQAALEGTQVGALGGFRVEAVVVFKSDLQPPGPLYTRLHSLPLAANS